MSERLNKIFNNKGSKTKLIAYFVGCHPTYEKSLEIIKAAIDNGVSIVEIGYSTSEASAEGPVIKAAQDRVIANGSSLQDVIKLAKEIRSYNKNVGIILMGYISNIFMFPIPNPEQTGKSVYFLIFLTRSFTWDKFADLTPVVPL